jgi:hypothetical protein
MIDFKSVKEEYEKEYGLINSSTRLALTLLAAFFLDWRRISAASSAGR